MVGYGKDVYTYRRYVSAVVIVWVMKTDVTVLKSQYWLWCPIIAPILGAQFGTMFYDAFLYNGEDGKFNQP